MDNGELQEENQQMVILIQGLFPAYKKRWCFVLFYCVFKLLYQ